MKRRKKPTQLALHLPRWGGARKGAGRKPNGKRAGVSHLQREALQSSFPVHVTLRVKEHVYNLRSKRCFTEVAKAFRTGCDRFGFRLIHFSVQGNHLHLICEATGRKALARGIQGISIRIAKGLNRVMGKQGRIFADRYYSRILRTPTEVRHALAYVAHNAHHHGEQFGRKYAKDWVDPYSSAYRRPATLTVAAQSWLLKVGWTKAKKFPRGQSGRS